MVRSSLWLGYHILLYTVLLCSAYQLIQSQNTSDSTILHIGALLAINSNIGQIAKYALELAVLDVNRDVSVLNGSTLVLHMMDTNCSAFQGAAAAMELLKKEVLAVAGPQSTSVAHFVAHMGGSSQVPLVSFAATDPALSEFQYPYLFRLSHNDAVQMAAIAALVANYRWREVVALYSDDDFGANGAAALSDALEVVGARLVQKVALPPNIDALGIGSILSQLAAMQTRVFVVHMPQGLGLMLFSEAQYLGMMSPGYAWIATDSIIATLGSMEADADRLKTLDGIIGTRRYYPDSVQARSFMIEWKEMQKSKNISIQPHIYGLYAYDSIWMIAHALDKYLKDNLNLTFNDPIIPPSSAGGKSELAQLRVFQGGPVLRSHLLKTKFNGTSGFVDVNSKGDLISSAFEVVNMVGQVLNVVGYWTNETQLSLSSPNGTINSESLVQEGLQGPPFSVIWPGGSTERPRGWVLPKNGRPLKIAIPNKAGFTQFVWSDNTSSFHGFCIDVFENALKYLPYSVPYTFVPYGNQSTPIYNDMIDLLADNVFDAVVGDVTITTKRLERVDFTQPYSESGLVVVVPIKDAHLNYAWAFLRPFTPSMWLVTLAFFIFTGIVVWLLEHKLNRDFRGHPKRQVVTVLWFTFSTLFFSQREKTKSALGRFVIIIWLFVVLIITSSYTANLTSILTVQELIPTIQGISSLQASDVPIGYQTGSFVQDYLISLNIAKERLKPYPSMDAYARALHLGPSGGGVAAVVDELPYVQVFLGTQCGFTIAGQEFTKGGWGFAFPKDSEMAIDISTAILTMSESGVLQRIHDMWLTTDQCGSPQMQVQSNQLSWDSFWGLFLVTGLASTVCLLIYLFRLLWEFSRRSNGATLDASSGRSMSARTAELFRSFAAYIDEPHPNTNEPNKPGKKKSKKHSRRLSDRISDNENSQLPTSVPS